MRRSYKAFPIWLLRFNIINLLEILFKSYFTVSGQCINEVKLQNHPNSQYQKLIKKKIAEFIASSL